MKQVIKVCCPDMEEKKSEYKKPPKYCPDCGEEVEMIFEVKPITSFEEWIKSTNMDEPGAEDITFYKYSKVFAKQAWEAGREQFILYCYKMHKDDEEDGSGYLCDEILSKGTKILKGEKLS